jgi:hypothetical protein
MIMNRILLLLLCLCFSVIGLTRTDNFNRTQNPLASGWTTITGYGDLQATGTRCEGTSSACAANWTDEFGADQYSQCVVKTVGDYYGFGPMVRVTNSSNFYRIYISDHDAVLKAMVSGSESTIGTATTVINNVDDVLKLQALGDSISIWVNGTRVLNVHDDGNTDGVVGLLIHAAYSSAVDDWEGGDVSGCTPATITRATTRIDTIGQAGKWGHATANSYDSINVIGTWPDSSVMLAKTTKDTVAYHWKKKYAKAGYQIRAYSCAGANTADAYDTITVVGPSLSYTPSTVIDTVHIPIATMSPASVDLADSITAATPLLYGLSLNKSTGAITGTPTADSAAATYKLYVWRGGLRADSVDLTLSAVYGPVTLDSIAPDSGYAGDTVTVYGRHFGIEVDSLSGTMGGEAIGFTSCTNTEVAITIPAGIDTGLYDIILGDGTTSDTLVDGYHVDSVAITKFDLTMVNSTPAGTISPTAGAHSLDSNTSQAITHTPAACYGFSKWTRTASTPASPIADSTLSSTSITVRGAVTVTAVDTILKYMLTMATTEGGTVTPASGVKNCGAATAIEAITGSASGLAFDRWTRSGATVTIADSTDATTTAALAGAGTVTAHWTCSPATVSYSAGLFQARVCTVGVAIRNSVFECQAANADSVNAPGLPAGLSITKTAPNIGMLYGTPTGPAAARAGYLVTAYGCQNGTAYDTITVRDTTCEHPPTSSGFNFKCTTGVAITKNRTITYPYDSLKRISGALPSGVAMINQGNLAGTPTVHGNFLQTWRLYGCADINYSDVIQVVDTSIHGGNQNKKPGWWWGWGWRH